LRVAQHGAPIRVGDEFARIRDLVGGITGLEVLLLTIEQGRRQRSITFACKPVANRPDVMIDAENFLDDHNAAFCPARRTGPLGTPLKFVGWREGAMIT